MMVLSSPKWTALLSAAWVSLIGPGNIDGSLFPAVTNVTMTAVQDIKRSDWVIVSGSFLKTRENCNPEFINWRLGDRNGMSAPVEYIWGRPQVRSTGENDFKDWVVRAAPPEVFAKKTFANVHHQCFVVVLGTRVNLPWLTITKFWN